MRVVKTWGIPVGNYVSAKTRIWCNLCLYLGPCEWHTLCLWIRNLINNTRRVTTLNSCSVRTQRHDMSSSVICNELALWAVISHKNILWPQWLWGVVYWTWRDLRQLKWPSKLMSLKVTDNYTVWCDFLLTFHSLLYPRYHAGILVKHCECLTLNAAARIDSVGTDFVGFVGLIKLTCGNTVYMSWWKL